jgi:general secretion pathway protein K
MITTATIIVTVAKRKPQGRQAANHQRGAAMLLAMLIVALVASLAGTMVWLQWRAMQVEISERARSQASWILLGAMDWARLILREDARTPGADHLGEPWAVPLAEARLSTFLAADKNNTSDAPEAFLAGQIADAQARFNLNNLVDQGKPVEAQVRSLTRLLDSIGVAPSLAASLTEATLAVASGREDGQTPIAPRSLDQLAWLGVPQSTIDRMRPYVTILPRTTPVNLNTAPREVIAALIDGLDLGSAERLVQARKRQPLNSVEEAKQVLGGNFTLDTQRVGISSTFFEVRGRLRTDDLTLEELYLVERRGMDVVVIQRKRVAGAATGG